MIGRPKVIEWLKKIILGSREALISCLQTYQLLIPRCATSLVPESVCHSQHTYSQSIENVCRLVSFCCHDTQEHHLKGGKTDFGWQSQTFLPIAAGPCCCGPVVGRASWQVVSGGTSLLTTHWLGNRETARTGGEIRPSRALPQWPTSSNQAVPPNSPLHFEFINGSVRWLGQSSDDLILFQCLPAAATFSTCGLLGASVIQSIIVHLSVWLGQLKTLCVPPSILITEEDFSWKSILFDNTDLELCSCKRSLDMQISVLFLRLYH